MPKEIYLCIHGHFYQPPRENPWIEHIEPQQSAYPFHDWNERIHQECYFPNTAARVLDEKGHLADIVNNFEGINFNVGPTLMSWLEEKHPETYQKIIEADRKSKTIHGGYGNAIAQVYNHMIMPLATRRDKITQVKWGIEDFRYRFGREPEAIWLPETACDQETLEVLIDEGMKFIILEPAQAEAIRPLSKTEWQDVSGAKIDPKHPYRCFLQTNPEKYIDIFFYDGPISKAVAFGDLLFEAKMFMDRIEGAKTERDGAQLIHIATDGESFGHHRAFGDRALAYLLSVEAPKRGFNLANYSEFLKNHPTQYAVRPYFGEKGEGTSWSCAHGIKRWKEHCGCRGEGPAEWTQHWRKPLREALDWLRDELHMIFENHGRSYLKDVWHARNEYVRVVRNRSEQNVELFFKDHSLKPLEPNELTFCLKLLEMERYVMLMYTSCGWFFSEISGIETVQILQYAARALELAEEITNSALEEKFLQILSNAKSNIPQFKDGRSVWEKLVKPVKATFSHVVSFYGIHSIFEDYGQEQNLNFYCFKLRILHQRKEVYHDLTLNFGVVKITSSITLEEQELVFAVLQFGAYDFRCSIKPLQDIPSLEEMEQQLFDEFHSTHVIELVRKIDDFFGEKYYSLKEIPLEWRIKIISMLTRESIEKINSAYDRLYEENRRMNEIYRSINLPIPDEIRYAVDHTLKRRMMTAIVELSENHFDTKKTSSVYKLAEIAKELNVELKKNEISAFLSNQLAEKTKDLAEQVAPEKITECLNILKVAKKINVLLEERAPQDHLFSLLKKWKDNPDLVSQFSVDIVNGIFRLASAVRISSKELKKSLQKLLTDVGDASE